MKKTVLYKEIDGHKIIIGIDYPTIDPVETKKIVDAAIKSTPEYQALEDKKAEFAQAVQDFIAAQKARDKEKFSHAKSAMKVRQEELKPLAVAYADMITALRIEHAVYFTPRMGEVIRTSDEVKDLVAAIKGRPEGTFIDLAGKTIEDNRGTVYYRKTSGKWRRTHIVKLGEKIPSGAKTEDTLTDAETVGIERQRIQALTPQEKASEKADALDMAVLEAEKMDRSLEIQGDPDHIAKSKAWLTTRQAEIESMYS